jgi:hypothetical protein
VEKRSKHFCNSTFWKPACFFAVCSRYLREICESDRSIKITEEEFERIRNALLVPRGNAGLSKLQAPNALLSERRTSKQGGGASRPKIHRFLEQFEPEQSYRVPGANRSLSGRTGCLPDLTRGTLHAMHVPDLSRNSYFGEPNFLRHTAGHGAPVNCAMAVVGWRLGLPWQLSGVMLRVTIGFHLTWLVNSLTHLWGSVRLQSTRRLNESHWRVCPADRRRGLAQQSSCASGVGYAWLRMVGCGCQRLGYPLVSVARPVEKLSK